MYLKYESVLDLKVVLKSHSLTQLYSELARLYLCNHHYPLLATTILLA